MDDIGRQRDFKSHTCTNLIKGAMQGPFENNLVIQVDIDIMQGPLGDIGRHGDSKTNIFINLTKGAMQGHSKTT